LNEYKQEEVLIKIEPDQTVGATTATELERATQESLGEVRLLTDNSRTMSCIPPWKKRNS
jgi:hypothetical protein